MQRQRYSAGRKPVVLALVCTLGIFVTGTVHAQQRRVSDVEKRMTALEKRVRALEQRLDQALSPSKYSEKKGKSSAASKKSPVRLGKSPIRARLVRKNLKLAGGRETEDNLALLITFKNDSPQGIVSFKGDIVFLDVYADSILTFFAEIEKAIPGGMSNTWFGGIAYDATNEGHRRLLDTSVDRIKTYVKPEVIVFSDGSIKTFEKKK